LGNKRNIKFHDTNSHGLALRRAAAKTGRRLENLVDVRDFLKI
jgi:hypothetical protein